MKIHATLLLARIRRAPNRGAGGRFVKSGGGQVVRAAGGSAAEYHDASAARRPLEESRTRRLPPATCLIADDARSVSEGARWLHERSHLPGELVTIDGTRCRRPPVDNEAYQRRALVNLARDLVRQLESARGGTFVLQQPESMDRFLLEWLPKWFDSRSDLPESTTKPPARLVFGFTADPRSLLRHEGLQFLAHFDVTWIHFRGRAGSPDDELCVPVGPHRPPSRLPPMKASVPLE